MLLKATRGGKDVAWKIPTLDVRLRMLAPTPKMEWKARHTTVPEVVATDGNVRSAAQHFKEGGARQHARKEEYPPMPVVRMRPVTKFSGYDMRNDSHMYDMLHGNSRRRPQRQQILGTSRYSLLGASSVLMRDRSAAGAATRGLGMSSSMPSL